MFVHVADGPAAGWIPAEFRVRSSGVPTRLARRTPLGSRKILDERSGSTGPLSGNAANRRSPQRNRDPSAAVIRKEQGGARRGKTPPIKTRGNIITEGTSESHRVCLPNDRLRARAKSSKLATTSDASVSTTQCAVRRPTASRLIEPSDWLYQTEIHDPVQRTGRREGPVPVLVYLGRQRVSRASISLVTLSRRTSRSSSEM